MANERIKGCLSIASHVFKALGNGHTETIYHRAMEVGLRKRSIKYESERVIPIRYEDHVIGSARVDLILADTTVVELKSVTALRQKEATQLRNYMDLAQLTSGLVINFPPFGDTLECHAEGLDLSELGIDVDFKVASSTSGAKGSECGESETGSQS